MSFQRLVIVGINGGFGMLLSNLLTQAGYAVDGIDLQPQAGTSKATRYVSANIIDMPAEASGLIREADCVILSLPEPVTLACFPKVVDLVAPNSLIVDLLSVKSGIVNLMEKVERPIELLSLHPMFAPTVGFREQNVIAIEVKPGPVSARILEFIENCGASVTPMSAEQHDGATAAIQVASHAALISFGLALNVIGYSAQDAIAVSTPLHRVMLSMVARILAGEPEIYWRIQIGHPLAARARESLKKSLQQIEGVIQANDFVGFENLLNSARETLGPEMQRLKDYSVELIKTEM